MKCIKSCKRFKLAEAFVTQGVKKLKYVTPTCRVGTAEELGLNLKQLAGDSVQISKKSPLCEFMSYMKGFEKEGNSFKPTFASSESTFARYFKDVEVYNAYECKRVQ